MFNQIIRVTSLVFPVKEFQESVGMITGGLGHLEHTAKVKMRIHTKEIMDMGMKNG